MSASDMSEYVVSGFVQSTICQAEPSYANSITWPALQDVEADVPGEVELYRLIGFASSEFTLSCGSATEFVKENLTAMIRPVVSDVISGIVTSFGDVSAAVEHVANGIAFATSAFAFHAVISDELMPAASLAVNTGSVSV